MLRKGKRIFCEKKETLLIAQCDRVLGDLCSSQNKKDQAMKYFSNAYKVQESANVPTEKSAIFHGMARISIKNNDHKKAIELLEKALPLLNPQTLEYASINNDLGVCYLKKKMSQKAVKCHQMALDIRLRNKEEDCLIALSYGNLALALLEEALLKDLSYEDERYKNAIEYVKKAIDIANQQEEKRIDILLTYMEDLAFIYKKQGKIEEAKKQYEEIFIFCRDNFSANNNPALAKNYGNAAQLYYDSKDFEKAYTLYKMSLDIQCQQSKKSDIEIARSHVKLGNTAYLLDVETIDKLTKKSGRTEKEDIETSKIDPQTASHTLSINHYKKGLKIIDEVLPTSEERADVYYNMANVLFMKKEHKEARNCHQIALDGYNKHLEENHEQIGHSCRALGHCYNALEEFELAIKQYTKALEVYKKIYEQLQEKSRQNDKADLLLQQKINQNTRKKIADTYNDRGVTKNNNLDHVGCINDYKEALRIKQKSNTISYLSIARTYDNLASSFFMRKKYKKSKEYYEKAFDIIMKQEYEFYQKLKICISLGTNYRHLDQTREAYSCFKKASILHKEGYIIEENIDLITLYTSLVYTAYDLEKYQESIDFSTIVLKMLKLPCHKNLSYGKRITAKILEHKGWSCQALKKHKDAITAYKEAYNFLNTMHDKLQEKSKTQISESEVEREGQELTQTIANLMFHIGCNYNSKLQAKQDITDRLQDIEDAKFYFSKAKELFLDKARIAWFQKKKMSAEAKCYLNQNMRVNYKKCIQEAQDFEQEYNELSTKINNCERYINSLGINSTSMLMNLPSQKNNIKLQT